MDPVGPCLEVLMVDTQIRELRVQTDVRWEVEMVETRYVVSRRVKLASPASPVRTKHAAPAKVRPSARYLMKDT